MIYTQIKSSYIKSLISQTSWENHSIIDDLIKLEEYIKNWWANTYIGNLHFASIKYNHHDHYLNLLKEIDIEKYNQVMIDLDREKKNTEETEANNSNEINEIKKDWITAGGK